MTNEINLDILLIKLFINKDLYNKYKSYINNYLINNYKTNNKLLYKLYRCLELVHNDNTTPVLEDVYLRLLREYPALPSDEVELALQTLQKAAGSTCQESELQGYLQAHYERSRASDVALKAVEVAEGKAEFGELQTLLDDNVLSRHEEEAEKVFYDASLEDLYASTKGKRGLRWPIESLNLSLGSLREGDFGFLFARPETGKTTFLSHIGTHMVSENPECRLLWINNEEGGNKVLLRCYQSLFGVTTDKLFSNRKEYQEQWNKTIANRIKLLNDPSLTYKRLDSLTAEYKPRLVIIDQLDKVQGFEAERNDLTLKAKYQWAREVAKKQAASVIGVCQAGGTAENKKWLTMNDVDSSHTAKQGEADWLFGIGKVDQDGLENVRFINIGKNKLVGDDDSLESMRHGQFDVLIDTETGRYRDRINWK